MADINELMFIGSFGLFLLLFVTQLYNVFMRGKWHGFALSFLRIIGGLLIYGVLFVTTLVNTSNLLMTQLFQLSAWVLLVMWILFLIEIFFFMSNTAENNVKPSFKYNYKAYIPKPDNKKSI